jgi:hypothetical protein
MHGALGLHGKSSPGTGYERIESIGIPEFNK